MIPTLTSLLMGEKWMFLVNCIENVTKVFVKWNLVCQDLQKYKKDWSNCLLQHLVLRNQVFHFLWNMTKILIVLLCTTILATSSVKSSIHKYEAVVAVRKQPKNTRELTHFIVNQWRKNKRNQVTGNGVSSLSFSRFKSRKHYSLLISFKLCFHEKDGKNIFRKKSWKRKCYIFTKKSQEFSRIIRETKNYFIFTKKWQKIFSRKKFVKRKLLHFHEKKPLNFLSYFNAFRITKATIFTATEEETDQ